MSTVWRRCSRAMWLATLTVTAACAGVSPSEQPRSNPRPGASSVARAAIATAHPDATRAGLAILGKGGNAVDAAVAAAFAVGVVEPHASGLGGEGVIIIYQGTTGTTEVVDFKSVAPMADTPDAETVRTGYPAAAVPGMVAGLCQALDDYGSMERGEVLEPAIRLADDGFEVSPGLAAAATDHFEALLADAPLAEVFCPSGLPVERGARIRMPDLAATLRAIRDHGADGFYTGAVARQISDAAAAHGGGMTVADLAAYRPIRRAPLRGEYRGYTILTTPGPTGGLPLLENLSLLERFDVRRNGPLEAESVHLVTEVVRRGFADFRTYVADPAFVAIPTASLLSATYADQRASEIRRDAVSENVLSGQIEPWESPSTTALVVIDGSGTMVAVTQTISDLFGARVMVPGTGIILNDEMKNFSRHGVNIRRPGKRPRTSIAPTLVLRGRDPVAAIATPGAGRIVSTTTQILVNLIDHGMSLQDAIDAPRYYAHNSDPRLFIEQDLPAATIDELRRIGYPIEVLRRRDPFFGGAHGAIIDDESGERTGAADPRRDGTAGGL